MTPEEIDRLYAEMMEICRSEPMLAFELAERIIEQSATIGYKRHIPYAHDIHARGHHWVGRIEEAVEEMDIAISLAQEAGDRAIELLVMNDGGVIARDIGNHAQAKDYLSKAIELARESGDRASEALALKNLASVFVDLGDYPESLKISQQGLALAEETGDKYSTYLLLNLIGIIHTNLANYSSALEFYARALAYAEETGNKEFIASALGNIGSVQGMYGDNPRALEYFTRALALFEEIGNIRSVAAAVSNIGNTYSGLADYPRALEYLKRALELSEQISDRRSVGDEKHNIAEAEFLLGNLDAAYQGFMDTLNYRRNVLKSEENVATTLFHLGQVLIEQGKTDQGLARLEEALTLAEELGDKATAKDAHKALADASSKKGDITKAFEHQSKYIALDKEIFSEESRKSVEKFNMRVAIADMESQKELQRLRAEHSEQQLTNSTLQLIAQTELLSDLRSDLLQIARKIPPTEPAARELRERVKNLPCQSIDWEKFDAQFKAAHPEFVKKLLERFPELTPMEVRVSTLLRLNLKSHEIAKLFCLEERSIETHRFNIRKKLKLETKQSLSNFLNAL